VVRALTQTVKTFSLEVRSIVPIPPKRNSARPMKLLLRIVSIVIVDITIIGPAI